MLLSLQIKLRQPAVAEFSAFVDRKHIKEPEIAGNLPGKQGFCTVGLQNFGTDFADDAGDGLLTTMWVGDTEYDRLANARAGAEDVLDFDRVELTAGDIDEIAHASGDDQPLWGTAEEVAGDKPAVAEDVEIGLREIAEAHRGA